MNTDEVLERLTRLRKSSYPLVIDSKDAVALVSCIQRILELVPDDDLIFVRGDYDLVTSALHHPEPDEDGNNTNEYVG